MSQVHIINDDELFEPEQLSSIDLKTSIILCSTQLYNIIIPSDPHIYLTNNKVIDIFSLTSRGGNFYYDHKPQLKYSLPKGIFLRFSELEDNNINPYGSIITKVFKSIDQKDMIKFDDHYIVKKTFFTILFNQYRLKGLSNGARLNEGELRLDINLEFSPYFDGELGDVYIIQNNFVFSDFERHFSNLETTENLVK